jgi:hypothetical protein
MFESMNIPLCEIRSHQGDQIGRIFAFWASVYLEQFFENYRNRQNLGATFFTVKVTY